MTARRKRGAALLIGGLLGLLFTLLSAVQVAGWTIGAVERTSRQTIAGPVKNLTVDAGPGEIQILPSQDGDVHVETHTKGSLHAPRVRAVKDGTHVMMSGNCPAFSFGPCDAEIVLHVPVGTAVEVRSASGDIVASGVGGPLVLDTDSGDVTAIGVTGSADLRTASGDVEPARRQRRGAAGVPVRRRERRATSPPSASRAETQSGDVNLDFRVPPRMVEAKATSGDVNVALPDAGSYDVAADTGSGDSQIGVRTDPDSPRMVRARTNSGDATSATGTSAAEGVRTGTCCPSSLRRWPRRCRPSAAPSTSRRGDRPPSSGARRWRSRSSATARSSGACAGASTRPSTAARTRWKAAISVRYGRRLHLQVGDARPLAGCELTYDRETREGAPRLRFTPCAPDTPRFSDDGVVGDETAWAGGFNVKREGCATLLLRREGEEQWRKLRVGFGVRCR